MFDKLITWLDNHQQPCFYKKFLGIECPGCGLQRAFIELLKGNILESIQHYPALLPIIFMFFFLFLHLVFNYKKGAMILKITFIFNGVLIVLSYVFKMFIL